MSKKLLCLLLLSFTVGLAWGQNYQTTVSAITNCKSLQCIEDIKQKNKQFLSDVPVTKSFGLGAYRYLLDFELVYEINKEKQQKSYRLFLFVNNDNINYGLLEQLDKHKQVEAIYLFRNDISNLEKHVMAYNKLHKTSYTYNDLIRSVVSRQPFFWKWIP